MKSMHEAKNESVIRFIGKVMNTAQHPCRGLVMDTYMDTKAGFEINSDLASSLTSKDDEQNRINFRRPMTECMGLVIPWVYGAKGYAMRGFGCVVRSCLTELSGLIFINQRVATNGLGPKSSDSFRRKLIFEQINRHNVRHGQNGGLKTNFYIISRVNSQSSVLGSLPSIFARLMSIKILFINQSISLSFRSFSVSLQFKKTLILKCCK